MAVAARLGNELRGGEVIELIGDLGSGKTAFVRGLARGIGSDDAVRSPSFTLSNEYKAGKLTLHHFDFYRLNKPGIMHEEIAELVEDPDAVIVVEWAKIIENVLPSERLKIKIITTGVLSRQLSFTYPGSLKYLMPAEK